ncbi:MAG: ornithine carbamoyltransferase [Clostridia bacterium]|nr:ornithine carbamoyltransferase [Clostridia bacterium]
MKKDLLKLADLSPQEIVEILDLADKLKKEQKQGIPHKILQGKTLGMIFTKASTRTRVSFEVGIYQLGGIALYLNGNDIQLGRGEPIRDTARVLSRYLDGIMIRTYKQRDVEELARFSTIPIINGLTDYCHPCQVLADLQTIREYKGDLKGLKLAYIGDGNNMANSLIVGCIKMGMKIAIACPANYRPDAQIIQWGKESGLLELTEEPKKAAANADVFYTDVWASMGQESETALRKEAFAKYYIDAKLMKYAQKDAMVLHCLPAHREEEITGEVFEEHRAEIFDEAENRLHAQKAVMVKLMCDK